MDLNFTITEAGLQHIVFAGQIAAEMESSAKARGTGIARRSPELIMQKMLAGKAVIALTPAGEWAGFCYIEAWENNTFVSSSGLITVPQYRKQGLARAIKTKIVELAGKRFPNAKLFGLTTSMAVMKINSIMHFEPVIYSEITSDENFWEGCKSCVNYNILQSKNYKNCLCTAMLLEPELQSQEQSFHPLTSHHHDQQQSSISL